MTHIRHKCACYFRGADLGRQVKCINSRLPVRFISICISSKTLRSSAAYYIRPTTSLGPGADRQPQDNRGCG